jgi:pSer/pThr/pTyr-binding forkhead associated (FHA) protein
MFRVEIISGELAGSAHPLKPGDNVIGRSRSAEIRLASMDVSGRHARISLAGSRIFVENLSQYGTFVDGEPVTGRREISPGQVLKMGKETEIRVAAAEGESGADAPFEDEADTGDGVPGTAAATGAVAAGAFDDDLTVDVSAAGGGAYDDEEGATRAMHTRAATPDEIEHLKEKETQRVKNRMIMTVAGVAVLLTLGVIFRPRSRAPELEINWPVDEQEAYLNRFEAGPSGGRDKGQYDIRYPANGTFSRSEVTGGFVLSGYVGRDRDVPMRIIVQEELDLRFASMAPERIVEDWIEMISASGGAWRIDKPSRLALFYGDKNGVPYFRATYLRDDKGASWFGIANICRHGRRRIVVRAEAPAVEQVRTEKLLTSRLVYVADEFQFTYWPFTKIGENVPVGEALEQARRDLERMAPGTWMSLDKLLCGVLSRAVPAEDAETEKESLRLLAKLRENQALWFNSQQLAYESALFRGDEKHAQRVIVLTKGVFSEMSDQRYYTVRKWNAESGK